MAERIEPALTAEEWADLTAGRTVLPQVENYLSLQDEKYAHAAMALCNASLPDGDPRKITHQHVQAMREVLSNYDFALRKGEGDDADTVEELADILESLLPPPA